MAPVLYFLPPLSINGDSPALPSPSPYPAPSGVCYQQPHSFSTPPVEGSVRECLAIRYGPLCRLPRWIVSRSIIELESSQDLIQSATTITRPTRSTLYTLSHPNLRGTSFQIWHLSVQQLGLNKIHDNDFCSPERVDIWWEIPQYIFISFAYSTAPSPDHFPKLRLEFETLWPPI